MLNFINFITKLKLLTNLLLVGLLLVGCQGSSGDSEGASTPTVRLANVDGPGADVPTVDVPPAASAQALDAFSFVAGTSLSDWLFRVPHSDALLNSNVAPNAHSFHLGITHTGFQWVLLTQAFLVPVGVSTQVDFKSQLRLEGAGTWARVQASWDSDLTGGGTWFTVANQAGTDTVSESTFNQKTISLSSNSLLGTQLQGKTIRIRFLMEFVSGGAYTNLDDGIGWFIDQIQVQSGNTTLLTENAENGLTQVIPYYTTAVAAGDPLLPALREFFLSSSVFDGASSVHLYAGDQWFKPNHYFYIPSGKTSTLSFDSRLRYAGSGQSARVQICREGAALWEDLFVQTGNGSAGEPGFNPRTVNLSNALNGGLNGVRFQLRFSYQYTPPLDAFSLGGDSYGWFFSNIRLSHD